MLTLFVISWFFVYLMFFWDPTEEMKIEINAIAVSNDRIADSFRLPRSQVRLESQHVWYGFTFREFQDEYRLSTTASAEECAKCVRDFFTFYRAKVLSEDGHRILFSRGKKIFRYLGWSDTMVPQEIDVTYTIENGSTNVLIQYRVKGFGLRTPPNQLRCEVIKLRDAIHALCAERRPAAHGDLIAQV